ncbi:hypothetical protein PVK06_020223 [Gossypium arboreum]|uniref:Uncharacterized protein n=1 Tax=Gossypium arboreum TaxID=29729 RepID=A0ABR0PLZ1_GOSAR|nr:hypothetical protein PVK06_020223 [Gossypium arboreum]
MRPIGERLVCRRSIVDEFPSKELYDAPSLLDTAKQNMVSFCQLQAKALYS